MTLYICNLDKITKIFVAKAKQEAFSQIIVFSSKVIYINKIKINYFKHLNIVKQKTINKINKLCKTINITIKVIVMQYKQEIVNKNIYTIEKEIIAIRTTL